MTTDWDRIFRPNQLARLAESDPRGFLDHVCGSCARYMWESREKTKALLGLGVVDTTTMDENDKDAIRNETFRGVKNLADAHGLSFPDEEVKEKVRIEVERQAWLNRKR